MGGGGGGGVHLLLCINIILPFYRVYNRLWYTEPPGASFYIPVGRGGCRGWARAQTSKIPGRVKLKPYEN